MAVVRMAHKFGNNLLFWLFRAILRYYRPVRPIFEKKLKSQIPNDPLIFPTHFGIFSFAPIIMAHIFENMCHMGAKLTMPKCVEKISGSFGICDF